MKIKEQPAARADVVWRDFRRI